MTTTIRRAGPGDLRALAETGLPYYLRATENAGAPLRPTEFVDILQTYLADASSLVLVAERDGMLVGAIGGQVRNAVFYESTPFFFIAFWVVAPGQGWTAVRLLKAALAAAENATPMAMVSTLHGFTDARVPRLLARLGFTPTETIYVRSATP